MGVGTAAGEFLLEAKQRGVRFDRTVTIGRQTIFVGPARWRAMLEQKGMWPSAISPAAFRDGFQATPGFLDPVLRALGADRLDSVDASGYEGATIVHDLNTPVSPSLHRCFTLVYDGGTLEHIFNVPVALRSYMQMVEVGGHLIIQTMANNHFGHGFYQFSPDLFFRALSPSAGYEVERVVVLEHDVIGASVMGVNVPLEKAGPWYEVADPANIRSRVLLQTKRPVLIQVQARRVADVPIFDAAPIQSDYTAAWSSPGETRVDNRSRARRLLGGLRRGAGSLIGPERQTRWRLDRAPRLLSPARAVVFRKEGRTRSLRNRRWYRRVHD